MLQTSFQSFFVVAEKPHLGLALSIAAGVTNMVMDYVLIAVCDPRRCGRGDRDRPWATAWAACCRCCTSCSAPSARGVRLTRTRFYGKQLLHACTNGSSELMSNISSSIVGILYNVQLMRLIGEQGVAAYSVMMYVDFVFVATFLGFSIGSAPIVSYPLRRGQTTRS